MATPFEKSASHSIQQQGNARVRLFSPYQDQKCLFGDDHALQFAAVPVISSFSGKLSS
jgi:hypothetical protein